jgi:hypothetical protein
MKNLKSLKNRIQNDKLVKFLADIEPIVKEMDNSFWFQDKLFNNICHGIVRFFYSKDPVKEYCYKLTEYFLLCEDEDILFSKEVNKLIHGPWISCGYFELQELPANIDAFHNFMDKVNIIKKGYPHNPLKLKNGKKWNTIISKKGYFSYEKIK